MVDKIKKYAKIRKLTTGGINRVIESKGKN